MSILAKIDADLKEALKNKQEIRLSTLRLIKASIKNKSIDKQSPLNDEDIVSLLSSQIKQRKESIEQYTKAGRNDLADKEQQEIDIIKTYLPEELTPQEIDTIIQSAIKEVNASSPSDMGKVMKVVMPKTRGKADGKYVNERVKALLSI
ncbi:MAG: GatB/YqeY domain-containing protein [Thermodesulfovibrionales bacterium]|nr:GatB/YqeY domain-containing protein [Thermodesulfovibrionales bacterium]